ncbi:MAG: hypothetical protein ACOCWU_06860, partial [Spirochaetota bacterium]
MEGIRIQRRSLPDRSRALQPGLLFRLHVCVGTLLVFLSAGLPAQDTHEIDGRAARSVAPGTLESSVVVSTDLAPSFFDSAATRRQLADTPSGPWWSLAYGLELGYGFSPAVGARVSWRPGFTFPSRYSGDENRRRNGASNLRLEVPLLLPGGPVSFTAAPVGIIKIRGYDLDAQTDRRQAGETYIAEHPDRKAHALGVALHERLPLGGRSVLTAGQEVLFYFPADYDEQSLPYYDQN